MKSHIARQTLLIAIAMVIAVAAAAAIVQAGISDLDAQFTTQPPQMMSTPF